MVSKDAEVARRADELAREYGRAFSRSLLGAGGQQAEGFEDDPITYVRIGWSGGPLPAKMEAELSGRLSQVLCEDAGRLVGTQQQEARQRREVQSKEAFDVWIRRKQADARLRAAGEAAGAEMRTGSAPAELRRLGKRISHVQTREQEAHLESARHGIRFHRTPK